jgi:hypothetical protein
MRRVFLAVLVFASLTCTVCAQSDPAAPASKADIQRLFDAMHTRQMIHQMMNSMSQPMHQMAHEQCQKNADKMPPDCEQRLTTMMDNMFANMPWDEMIDAMMPAYQKHFTRGDIDAFVAFYNSPAGQKLLGEMPAITAESMQDMMPIMRRYMETVQSQVEAQMADMAKSGK